MLTATQSKPAIAKRFELTTTYAAVAGLAVFPFVLYLLNRWWAFLPPGGYIDPYVYTGYFLDLKGSMDLGFYQGSRLPWLLLGNAAYSVLSPEWANLVLRFLLFWGGTFSLFVIVRGLWHNTGAAFLAAVLLGTHTYFLWAIHWDYIDGPVIVFTLAAVAMTVCARDARFWALWLIGAGFLLLCAVGLNIINALPYPPALVLATLFFARRGIRGPVCLALGVVLSMLLFNAVYWHLTGDFNFLERQIDFASNPTYEGYRADSYAWLKQAGWLAYPMIAVACSAYALTRWRDELHMAVSGLMCLSVTTFYLLFQMFRGPVFEVWYYTGFLMPFVFVMIGGAIATVRLSPRQWLLLVGLALAFALAPMAVSSLEVRQSCAVDEKVGHYCSMAGSAGVLTLLPVLLLLVAKRWPAAVMMGVVSLALLNTAGRTAYDIGEFREQRDIDYQKFLMAYDIDRTARPYGDVMFWYSHHTAPFGLVFNAVAGLHHMHPSILSYDFPRTTNPVGESNTIPFDRPIAILTASGEDGIAQAAAALAKEGLRPLMITRQTVARGTLRADVTIIRVETSGREVVQFDLGKVAPYPPNPPELTGPFVTPAVAYGPAAHLAIPRSPYSNAYMVVRLNVISGPVEVCLMNADASVCLAHQLVDEGAAQVVLKPHDFQQAYYVLFRSGPGGKEGSFTLTSAALYVPE